MPFDAAGSAEEDALPGDSDRLDDDDQLGGDVDDADTESGAGAGRLGDSHELAREVGATRSPADGQSEVHAEPGERPVPAGEVGRRSEGPPIVSPSRQEEETGPTSPVIPDGVRQAVADVVVVTDVKGFWFAVYDQSVDLTNWALSETAPAGEERIEVGAEALASALDSVRRLSKTARGEAARLIAERLFVPDLAARLIGRVVAAFPMAHEELLAMGALGLRVLGALTEAHMELQPPERELPTVGHLWFAGWDQALGLLSAAEAEHPVELRVARGISLTPPLAPEGEAPRRSIGEPGIQEQETVVETPAPDPAQPREQAQREAELAEQAEQEAELARQAEREAELAEQAQQDTKLAEQAQRVEQAQQETRLAERVRQVEQEDELAAQLKEQRRMRLEELERLEMERQRRIDGPGEDPGRPSRGIGGPSL